MKVSTRWWGPVDVTYRRDADGREFLMCPTAPAGVLVARDLSNPHEYERFMTEALFASLGPVLPVKPPMPADDAFAYKPPVVVDSPGVEVPVKRGPGRPRKDRS